MKATVSAIVARAQTSVVQAVATASVQMFRLSVALGEFIKLKYIPDSATATDAKVLAFTKRLIDAAAALDVAAKSLTKATTESVISSDVALRSLGKVIADAAVTTDSLNRLIGKVLVDTPIVNDAQTRAIAKAVADVVATTDVMVRAADYFRALSDSASAADANQITLGKAAFDSSITADHLVREIQRSLTDNFFATDDVNGVGADDDQVLQVIKVFSELAVTADVLARTVDFLRNFDDSSVATDFIANHLTKSFSEVVTVADVIVTGAGYGQSSNDTATSTDLALLDLSKVLSDAMSVTDFAMTTFEKELTESAIFADETSKAAGKGSTDGVSASDSGDLFGQGYVSEDYFAERYVGYEQTF